MDRHNNLHKASRVELPAALRCTEQATRSEYDAMIFGASDETSSRARLAGLLGRIGLLTSSLVVIATASLLALYVR